MRYQDKLKEKEKELTASSDLIEETKKTLKAQKLEIENLNSKYTESEEINYNLKNELGNLETQNKILETKLKYKENSLNEEINDLKNSLEEKER
jgi:septal ring factor EnvC (AmiA/AmiB activator)